MRAMSAWEDYRIRNDLAARELLLSENLPLVHHVARRLLKTLSSAVTLDDLVNAGSIGLMHAIDTFDPGCGIAFSTYATPRIRGAMLDDLRRTDHLPRTIRRTERTLKRAREALMARLQRAPTDKELARHLEVDMETLWRWQSSASLAEQVSLESKIDTGNPRSLARDEVLVGSSGGETEQRLNQDEELKILKREILELSDQERQVLALYYFEELKLREIGEVLGLTESRVCQIRSKALVTLRHKLAPLREGRP